MRIIRISLMLLAVVLVISTGTLSPSGQNGAKTEANWPPCPPVCR